MNNVPAKKPNEPQHLSQERAAKREWIGGRIVTLLGHCFRPDDPVELTAAIGRDWANVLEGLPQEYIERACVAYLRAEPRKKPTPADIYQRARALIPPQRVAPNGKPVQERAARITAARANEVLASAGFKPKQFGGSDL